MPQGCPCMCRRSFQEYSARAPEQLARHPPVTFIVTLPAWVSQEVRSVRPCGVGGIPPVGVGESPPMSGPGRPKSRWNSQICALASRVLRSEAVQRHVPCREKETHRGPVQLAVKGVDDVQDRSHARHVTDQPGAGRISASTAAAPGRPAGSQGEERQRRRQEGGAEARG
jgi:hypothetical protein